MIGAALRAFSAAAVAAQLRAVVLKSLGLTIVLFVGILVASTS